RGGSFEGLEIIFGIGRRCGIEQESDPGDAWCNLLEKFQPLAGHRRLHNNETRDVAAGARKARDETTAEWIGHENENDGDAARLLQQSGGGGRAMRKNEIGLQHDQFLRETL